MEIVSPMCHASSAVTQLYAPTQNTYKSAPRLLTSCCTGPTQLAGERCQTWLCIVPISSSPGRAVSELHHVQGTSLQLMTTRAHFPPAFSVHPLAGGWLHHHVPKPQFSKGQVSLSSWALGQPHYKSPGERRALGSLLTMSSLPFFCSMLEKAIVVRTQAASEQYVLMAARCWASPCSEMAELKLGQYIHR